MDRLWRSVVIVPGLAVIASAIAPARAAAQWVRGTMRDSASGIPIGGGVVWLTDNAGAFLARALADSAGHFAVMRLPGAARLHAVRIGFRPNEAPVGPLPTDSLVDVRMAALPPLTLDAVTSVRQRVCRGNTGTPQALALWQQARDGLFAAVVARDRGAPTVRLLSYSRRLDSLSPVLGTLSVTSREVVADRSYVAAQSAGAFVSEGYMREDRGGARTYFAPDEEVLLDPSFADTHCLHVVEADTAHRGAIGIAFDPVPGRGTLVDVAGVLWLSRDTPQLRSLEFHYTGLEPAARESGGEIVFHLMPSGAPMITRWSIRSAQLTFDEPERGPLRYRLRDRADRTDARVVAYHEFGGVVADAQWPDGSRWVAVLPGLSGTVFNLSGTPVRDVSVWIVGGADTVTTDSVGHYTLHTVLPGTVVVRAGTRELARVGVAFASAFARADSTGSRRLSLYLQSLRLVLRERCLGQTIDAGAGVLLGRVVDEQGSAVADARVDATFTPNTPTDGRPLHRREDTDTEGRFSICGVPPDQHLHLRAATIARHAETDLDPSGPVVALTIVIRPE